MANAVVPLTAVRDRRRKAVTRQARVAKKVSDIPPRQLACRIRHRWPLDEDLEPGRRLPRGVEVIPQYDSTYMIRETCKRCGKRRIQDTLPGGQYDIHAPYRYDDPDDWVKMDGSLSVTRRDLRGYAFGRAIR